MAAPRDGSRERLLDAAEFLFAERGYDATTTRDVAARAESTMGTLSYHFHSKDGLLGEVVGRRFHELSDLRRTAYKTFSRNGERTPTLAQTIVAIVQPAVERAMCGGAAWASYVTLMSRLYSMESESHSAMIADLGDGIGAEMLTWLQAAVPNTDRSSVIHTYHFIIGTMLTASNPAQATRLRRISSGFDGFQYREMSEKLLDFLIGGARVLLDGNRSAAGDLLTQLETPGVCPGDRP